MDWDGHKPADDGSPGILCLLWGEEMPLATNDDGEEWCGVCGDPKPFTSNGPQGGDDHA